ncbi:MAG: pilin [Patescibacteria group bacterium]
MFSVYRRPVITTRLIVTISICLLGLAFLSGLVASAGDGTLLNLSNANQNVDDFSTTAGFSVKNAATPQVIAGQVIGYVIAFLGTVFFILMVYGGWVWLLAKGNEDEVKRAKDLIRNAIIGLIIVFAAYTIATFVVTQVYSVSTGRTESPPPL